MSWYGNTWAAASDDWSKGAWGQGKGAGGAWGKSKGKGKSWKSKNQDDNDMQEQNTADHTGRIWRRYQLPCAILRASVDPESGSCFVPGDKKQRKSDGKMLDDENMMKLLTPSNAHLLRRVGTGLSEAAGNVEALIKVAQCKENRALAAMLKAIDQAGEDLQEALGAINSFDKKKLTAEEYAKAFDTVATFIKENEEALEKGSIAGMAMHGRSYLGSCALRQLVVCVKNPDWWSENIPESLSDSKTLAQWKKKPKDKKRMNAAMGALMEEKAEADDEYRNKGKDDYESLMQGGGKKKTKAETSESSSSSDKKKKKSKKSKKDKKKKSSSSEASSEKADRKKSKDNYEKDKKSKQAPQQKSKEKDAEKERKRKAPSSDGDPMDGGFSEEEEMTTEETAWVSWGESDLAGLQELLSVATDASKVTIAQLKHVASLIPKEVQDAGGLAEGCAKIKSFLRKPKEEKAAGFLTKVGKVAAAAAEFKTTLKEMAAADATPNMEGGGHDKKPKMGGAGFPRAQACLNTEALKEAAPQWSSSDAQACAGKLGEFKEEVCNTKDIVEILGGIPEDMLAACGLAQWGEQVKAWKGDEPSPEESQKALIALQTVVAASESVSAERDAPARAIGAPPAGGAEIGPAAPAPAKK